MGEELDLSTSDLAALAAEELWAACERCAITLTVCEGDGSDVDVTFNDLKDAETLISQTVDWAGGAGSLADRVSGGCTGLGFLNEDATSEDIAAILRSSWDWVVHPHQVGCRTDWHVSVSIPAEDALTVAAALNADPRGR